MSSISFLPVALALGVGAVSVDAARDRVTHGTGVAQQFTIDTRGEGEFRVDRRRVRLNRVVVTFRDNGLVEVRGMGEANIEVQGRYFARNNDSYDVNVTFATYGGEANGRGTIALRGRRDVKRISLRGEMRNGGDFELVFDDRDGDGWGNRPPSDGGWDNRPPNGGGTIARNIDARGRGRGTLASRRREYRVTGLRVRLGKGGDARIIAEGDYPLTLEGTWSGGRRDRYEIDVSSGFGASRTTGRGYVAIDGDRIVEELDLRGFADGEGYHLEFGSNRGPRPLPPSGGNDDNVDENIGLKSRGRGEYTFDGRRQSINEGSVQLGRGGDFKVGFDGKAKGVIEGFYERGRDGRYIFRIAKAFGDENATGTGSAVLRDDREIEQFQFRGTFRGRPFSVSFNAN